MFLKIGVTGCYFYLCHSTIRKECEVGLKENSNQLRNYIRCLIAFAFVPFEDVVEAFEILVETMPTNFDHLEDVN